MADPKQQPTGPSAERRSEKSPRMRRIDAIAACLSVAWILLAGGFFLFANGSSEQPQYVLRFVTALGAVIIPAALIWVVAAVTRLNLLMRGEFTRLHEAIGDTQQSGAQPHQTGGGTENPIERKLEEMPTGQHRMESAMTAFVPSRPESDETAPGAAAATPAQNPEGREQEKLALNVQAGELGEPVAMVDFIRALNFPEDLDDKEGFGALRRVLRDYQAAQLVRASRDMLTMLSQEGIYVDDLRPGQIRPELWRKFAQGERGRAIAGLGGVRNARCLKQVAKRMRRDTAFHDASQHFLRHFDKVFAKFEPNASDADIEAFSNTRTARAFMLFGQVAGTFAD